MINGELSAGELIAFMLYTVQIAGTLGMLSGLLASLYSAAGASRRAFQLIDRAPRVPVSGGRTLPSIEGRISFEVCAARRGSRPFGGCARACECARSRPARSLCVRVCVLACVCDGCARACDGSLGRSTRSRVAAARRSDLAPRAPIFYSRPVRTIAARCALLPEHVDFAYPTRPDAPVLRAFSVEVPPNATFAFVGPSGGGKSTVLALLERFYDVSAGAVRVDGVDVRELDPSWLRGNMALVQQEPVLYAQVSESIY